MNTNNSKAEFWKCALQVNPYLYIENRGKEQELTETEYNSQLLQVCLDENIKVLGIADHGNVDGIDNIRILMNSNNIMVLPGFEISSSEKIHYVCLFDEKTTKIQLERYLGNLELCDPEDGITSSILSSIQIFEKIEEFNGFIYAAHCTDDNGLLKNKNNNIWKNKLLLAAQIPNTIEELKSVEDDFYRKALLNKNPEYKREKPIVAINAKDIEKPETLKDPRATTLVKMTNLNFEAFKNAFYDPQSRIQLNTDPNNHNSSYLKN